MAWFRKDKPEANKGETAKDRTDKKSGEMARKARTGDKEALKKTRQHYENLSKEARDVKPKRDK